MNNDSRKQKWMNMRSVRRQQSHDEAHAAIENLCPILKHERVPQHDPNLVDSPSRLCELVDTLRAEGRFAFDTEFIGEHSYHAKVCLIQTATYDRVSLIDPLASEVDAREMWGLIADGSVQKIVHAGEQDLEPVIRHTGRPPANVIDTQVLAAFAGLGFPVGMRSLVRDVIDADLGAGLTFSQWDLRPLSRVQILYAANDVRYLLLLFEKLCEKVRSLGNEQWATDECHALCSAKRFIVDPASQRSRVRGVDGLSPRQLLILTELIAWRERAAECEDVPPRSLAKDSILLDMTYNPPRKLHDLDRVSGLPRPVEQRWGAEIVESVSKGLDAQIPDGVVNVPFDRWAHRRKVDVLWKQAADRCLHRHIAPSLAISKREIGGVLRSLDLGVPLEQAAGRLMLGWRAELFNGLFSGA